MWVWAGGSRSLVCPPGPRGDRAGRTIDLGPTPFTGQTRATAETSCQAAGRTVVIPRTVKRPKAERGRCLPTLQTGRRRRSPTNPFVRQHVPTDPITTRVTGDASQQLCCQPCVVEIPSIRDRGPEASAISRPVLQVADCSSHPSARVRGWALTIRGMLTFRAGDPDRPRGHALVFFRDGESADQVWATYLVVAPIKMDLGKYIPAAFASQLAGQLSAAGPSAYPLPPVPEKFEGGLTALERLAELRNDDLLDGGTLRMNDPLYALQPVADIGTQYAELCARYFAAQSLDEPVPERVTSGSSSLDVDDLLLQVMPDRDKVSRLARLAGTLRY